MAGMRGMRATVRSTEKAGFEAKLSALWSMQVARERKLKRLKCISWALGWRSPLPLLRRWQLWLPATSNSPRGEVSVADHSGRARFLMILNLLATVAVGLYRYVDERTKGTAMRGVRCVDSACDRSGPIRLSQPPTAPAPGPEEVRWSPQTPGIGMLIGVFALLGLVAAFNVPWVVRWFSVATPWWAQSLDRSGHGDWRSPFARWLGRFLMAMLKVRMLLSEPAALAKAMQSVSERRDARQGRTVYDLAFRAD